MSTPQDGDHLDWQKARDHIKAVSKANHNVMTAEVHRLWALLEESGIRTQWLYDDIMSLEIPKWAKA